MLTTKLGKVPRVLVRITPADISALTEKEIITEDGHSLWMKLHHQTKEDEFIDRFTHGVRFARIEALSPGTDGILIGDIAILDYTVYANAFREQHDGRIIPAPHVTVDGKDLLVAVTCLTTYHTEYERASDNAPLTAAPGDVDEMGMLLGIIRDKQLFANPDYVFCQYEAEQYYAILKEDGESFFPKQDFSHIRRKVLAAHPDSGVMPGQTILAEYCSNIELEIMGFKFDIIPVNDIWGTVEE